MTAENNHFSSDGGGSAAKCNVADVCPLAFVEWEGRRERQVGHGRVLAVAVPPQVDLALEGLVAQTASERLVSSVLAHVGDQIGRLAEGFTAHDAFVRLFTCNNVGEKKTKTIIPLMHII